MVPVRRAVILTAVSLSLSCCQDAPEEGLDRGRVLFATCAPCHGDEGEGNQEYGAPAIAGLDAWYLETQLEHFRQGVRGAHPDDAAGLRMRPMVQTLRSEADRRSVAAYVASLPAEGPAPSLEGASAERGQAIYATCAECHGPEGRGDRERGAPDLTHASDWYLLTQLGNFKAGIRGADPRDSTGATMRPMAMALADEQAMRDVLAYIATLPEASR
jgi:cytochrome c oxidase subunit 2